MNLYSKLTLAAVAAAAIIPAATAGIPVPKADITTNRIFHKAPSSVFDNDRSRNIDRINQLLIADDQPEASRHRAAAENPEVAKRIGPAHIMGDLDAPNGEMWFYDGKLTYDSIPPDYEAGIWFTELILRRYDITIYNSRMEVVGTISDKMRYDPDEVRAPLVDVAPIVTQKFFNTDEYYEVAVGVATNPGVGMVREHSFIYSLGNGAKDDEGNDMPITDMRAFISDVLTIDSTIGSENYLISVTRSTGDNIDIDSSAPEWTGDPAESPYWKALMSQKTIIDVYTNATAGSDGPVKIASKEIPTQQLQGDQMSSPVILSTTYNGEGYMVFPRYEESFYNPYSSPWAEDVSMRQKNKLIIEIYKQSADHRSLELFQTTSIPVTKDTADDRILASYYSVGSMRFRQDIDFNPDHYKNTSGKAYLIVSRENYLAGSDDSYISSYYVYKDTGSRYKTLFTNSESTISLSDIPGHEPQQVFVSNTSGYTFHFVDLLSANEVYSTGSQFSMGDDEEPEALTANMDRVAVGDSYQYVIELRIPTVDENENDNIRAMWVKPNGEVDHIDEVNMGTGVMYGKMFLHSSVLKPGVFTSDKNSMAYMCLIKRGLAGSSLQEELLVARPKSEAYPDGHSLLALEPNENGVLSSVIPMMSGTGNNLWVIYIDSPTNRMTLDIYDMPLDKEQSGIDDTVADSRPDAIQFDGSNVTAQGSTIEVYNIAGVKVATGYETVAVDNLERGIYIVTASDGSTRKLRL